MGVSRQRGGARLHDANIPCRIECIVNQISLVGADDFFL